MRLSWASAGDECVSTREKPRILLMKSKKIRIIHFNHFQRGKAGSRNQRATADSVFFPTESFAILGEAPVSASALAAHPPTCVYTFGARRARNFLIFFID